MKNLKAFALVPLTFLTAISLTPGTATANNKEDATIKSDDAIAVQSASARIDELIAKGWKENKIKPNAAIDDETFVRRIYLDIAGRIPTIEEAEAFHSSKYEGKRERLIDELLNSDGYVSHHYNFWADVLRISSGLSKGAAAAEAAYQLWLKDALRDNKPYDEFVYELVAGTGYIWDNGAVAYYQRDRGMPLDNMSNTVRTFLGTRLECAQCHNHPFDKWTQMDYFKMAAFSYGMDANRYDAPNRQAMSDHINERRREQYYAAVKNEKFPMVRDKKQIERYVDDKNFERRIKGWGVTGREEFVALANKGIAAMEEVKQEADRVNLANGQIYNQVRYFSVEENGRQVKLPHDYQYSDAEPLATVEAATMFGAEIDLKNVDEEGIAAYGKWMTSSENPTFTKVIANRLWKKVFGHGVFEPLDELTDQTPVSNPELLAYLEQLMQELDYDMKAYMEVLYNTETYQRVADSSEFVLGADYYFPGPRLRRMTAEQVWDSIVALALPEADSYRPRLKQQLGAVEKIRRMYEALEGRTPEEYIAMMTQLGAALEANIPEQNALRQKMYVAREKDDMDLYKKLRDQLSQLQRGARETISEIGFNHTDQRVDADELLAAVGMNEMAMSADGSMNMMAGGGDGGAVLTKLPKPKMPEAPEGMDKKQLKIWKDQNKRDYSDYSKLVAGMARASELESPARRGHFLREFGQSDREVIENSAIQASVPQALNLLNGTISEALTNRFAVFGSRLHEAGDPEQKTKMIFQAMLSRQPTGFEMELAREEIAKFGDAAYEGIVWSLLNTQQFLFVQ